MALPSDSKYAISSLPNPASDLTDAVVGIDASRFPQEWWDAIDTTDATKARVVLDGTESELAFDFDTFDSTAQTGWIWVRVAGTIPASGTAPKVRVYPPQTANTSYSPTDTYGRNATWIDYEAVFHMQSDDPTSLTDSSGNGYDATIYYEDGQYLEQVDGMFGKAALFDHVWEHQVMNKLITFDEGMSIQSWLTPSVDKDRSDFTGDYSSDYISFEVGYGRITLNDNNGNNFFYYPFGYGSGESFNVGTDYKVTFTKNSSSQYTGYLDGTSSGEFYNNNNTGSAHINIERIAAGTSGDHFDGTIDEFRIANFVIDSDLESYQHENEDDQATFWGTWSVEGGAEVIALSPNSLAQAHTLAGSSITAKYSLVVDSGLHSQVLDPSIITGHNYIVLPEELVQNHSLDQSELIVAGVLVPESIEHPHNINESSLEILYSLLPTDMKQDHSVDSLEISVAYKLTPDQLDQDHLLSSGTITTNYLITPDDLSQNHELEEALLQIIGKASKVSLDANELYLVSLEEKKLYKVKLEEQEQYEMNLQVEERVK